jgi:hypothetical protein
MTTKVRPLWIRRVIAGLLSLWSAAAMAQTDEIQVYDGSLAPPGVFNLTLHDNYAVRGSTTPSFPGGLVSNHTLNGVPEWAWGITDWFEAGLYLPLYSYSSNEGTTFDGLKGRALFAVPHADERKFFYGVNFEFSYNTEHWDEKHFTSEIRPIVGWHLGRVDLIFNPALDNAYEGAAKLEFVPMTRVAYNFTPKWAGALEDYDDFGPLEHFYPASERSRQLFGVVDFTGRAISVEGGVGVGLTPASDDLVVKLILSKDLRTKGPG